MNKVEFLSPDVDSGRRPVASHELRAPPKAAKLLLCVWGYSYVRQFLECGLPTLLAPGNVPALAAALPTEFIILTSADDESFIVEHPAFKQLDSVCKTTIHPIDHLITDGNYSTTITLAFTEAVREVGEDMVDTCFFFLVSDYIVADGSFANALKRMQQGTSAVVVGNMQVARESALPWLQERLAGNELGLSLQPRELMQWALNNLHPLVLANIVNLPFSHNTDSNRLFWRVDGNTMIGRFYLMHMLCVRPEVTDFVIGSSCDYSFIPEMCPSGNVDAITDSDEYLVIEMQARMHEAKFLRPGPNQVGQLAKSLSEWTTVVHRKNANHSLFFHAEELPPEINRSVEEADAFIADIAKNLSRKPQPYRGHPYWHGAMAAFHEVGGRKLNSEEWIYALGLPETPEQADQLAALAFQIRSHGQAAERVALASCVAGLPDRDPRDRFLLHRSQPAHAAVVERADGVQRGAGRQRRAHAPAALPSVPEKSTRALRAAARQIRSVPARAQRNRHGGRRRADRSDRAAVEERRPHHSFRSQPARHRQKRRIRPKRHVPELPLHPFQRGADRNPFRAIELRAAVGPQRPVQAAADDEQDAVADRAADRGLRRLPAVVLVHRQHRCVAGDAARRRTRPHVELRHAAHRRCAQDRDVRMPIGVRKPRARSARLWRKRQAACCPPSPRRRASRNTIAASNCAIRSD